MVILEVDGKRNQSWFCRPIRKRIRGRFEWRRDPEPKALQKSLTEPDAIPGQRLQLNGDSLTVLEPLHNDEFKVMRERIEKKGLRLPDEATVYEVDGNEAAFWLQRAVDARLARVIDGKMPRIDATKVDRSSVILEENKREDKLTAAIERQNELFERLLAKLSPS